MLQLSTEHNTAETSTSHSINM